MFEREKQIIINKASEVIYKDTEEVPLKKIINLNLPEPILKFFVEDIEVKLSKELREIKNFSTFDFDLPEAQPFFAHAFTLLKMNRKIKKNEFSTILLFALDFNFDFILKPCESLTHFVFDYYEKLGYEAILEKLRFVIVYNYLTELITKYLQKKQPKTLDKNDFFILVRTLQQEYTQNYTLSEFYNHFSYFRTFLKGLHFDIEPLQEAGAFQIYLFDIGREDLAEKIEKTKYVLAQNEMEFPAYLKSVEDDLFSSDKASEPKIKRVEPLEQEVDYNVKELIEEEKDSFLDDIKNTLTEDHLEKQDTSFTKELEETLSFNDTFKKQLENINTFTEDINRFKENKNEFEQQKDLLKEKIKEEEIDSKQITRKEETTKFDTRKAPGEPRSESTSLEKEEKKTGLFSRFKIFKKKEEKVYKPEERVQPVLSRNIPSGGKELRNLFELIPRGMQKKLIKKIFNNSEEEFNASIRYLNSVRNWEEASKHLIEVFQKNDVEPYSSIALKFTELLYKHIS